MARKVILDVDPGIDDAVALVMALFDPRLDVVAVTAVSGNVGAEQATRNVQTIIDQLDPPRLPRVGAATEPEHGQSVTTTHIFGADGLGNAGFPVAELHHRHNSEKVIFDEVRAATDPITIIALGPLTNVARAMSRDSTWADQVGQLIIMGGAVTAAGNVTPAAEFNIYRDPQAARNVFHSTANMQLVPLDVTDQVIMNFDLLDLLPDEASRAGHFLRAVLPFAFRSHRQQLGLEGIQLHDAVALVAALHPELFTWQDLCGDVETSGELTLGATVFDRRRHPEWRRNLSVATDIDVAGVKDAILRAITAAGEAS